MEAHKHCSSNRFLTSEDSLEFLLNSCRQVFDHPELQHPVSPRVTRSSNLRIEEGYTSSQLSETERFKRALFYLLYFILFLFYFHWHIFLINVTRYLLWVIHKCKVIHKSILPVTSHSILLILLLKTNKQTGWSK